MANLNHVQRVRTLYKAILRLHRGMPSELKDLGTNYARDEFKRHKKCNEAEANVFVTEWTRYAITIAEQLGVKGPKTGAKLGTVFAEQNLDDFSEDQLVQLYELMLAATGKSDGVESKS